MAEEIGSLEIQIQAQATKANNAIDKLITKLDKLSTSLGSINSSSLVGLANGVNRLANSMQGMNNVKTADFTRIATGVQKLADINTASINRAASAMTQISKAVNGISVGTGASTQIAELAKGIAQLGYKSSTQAIENIPKLATAMQGLMTTLSKAPTVSQNLINMTNALAKLARTGSSSGKAANSLASSLNFFSNSANRAKTSSFSLAAAFGKLYASYWLLFRAFGKVKEMINLSSALTEVQNVVDVTFGNMASKVEEFSKTSIQQLGMSELAFKQYASRFQAMGSAMGINPSLIENANSFLSKQTDGYIGLSDSMSDVSINLTKLAADMASFYNVEQSAVAEDLESIFTGMTRPLRAYGLDLTEATLKEWALKNGLDADIDSMSQAQKTMLRYQYVLANTGAAQGDFARTSDTWANQIRILTENFKALGTIIGSWFVNALKPFVRALNQAMQYVIAFAETVTNALGSIFGWKFEVSGGGVADDWSDSMDGFSDSLGDAAGNAKKLKTQLLGIDELNVLSEDSSDSGSGIGSGGVSGVDGAQGQIVPAETIFKEYESNIKTLEQLGNKIRDSLIGALDSIQWENVFEKARNFGTGLADFLNGLLAYDGEGRTLFGKVAKTLANTLNTIVYAAQSFATKFDFYQFGVNLGDALNNFFETFDFKAAADTLNKWVDGLKETIKGFIDTADWGTVWQGIKDFFGELELDTVAVIIGSLVLKKILKTNILGTALSGAASTIASAIGASVTTAITNAGGLSGLLTLDMAALVGETGFATAGLLAGGAIIGGIVAAFAGWNFGQFLNEQITGEEIDLSFTEQMKEIKNSFTDGSWKGALELWGKDISDGLSAIGDDVNKWMEDTFGDWAGTTFTDLFDGIKQWWDIDVVGALDLWGKDIDAWFNENVTPWFTIEKWSELLNNALLAAQTKWAEITEWWNGTAIVTWWDESVAPWFSIEKWTELLINVQEAFNTWWETIKSWWQVSLSTWWKNSVTPWFTKEKWMSALVNIKSAFVEAFTQSKEKVQEIVQSMYDFVMGILEAIISKIKEIGSAISNFASSIGSGISEKLGIGKYAAGGFPESGSLFIANEAGPELVGTIGGKTAVSSNEEITGIREAVYESSNAEIDALNVLISIGNAILQKNVDITIDGRSLVDEIGKREERNGFSFA